VTPGFVPDAIEAMSISSAPSASSGTKQTGNTNTAVDMKLNTTDTVEIALGGGRLRVRAPLAKAVFSHLTKCWPSGELFTKLPGAALKLVPASLQKNYDAQTAHGLVKQTVFTAVSLGMLSVAARPPDFRTQPSKKPVASKVVREQVKTTSHVTNRRHCVVTLDHLARDLIQLLDGHRDLQKLTKEVKAAVDTGKVEITNSKGELVKPQAKQLIGMIQKSLQQFADMALLVG